MYLVQDQVLNDPRHSDFIVGCGLLKLVESVLGYTQVHFSFLCSLDYFF